MADYEISAEIKADSSGFTKGVNSAQKSAKSLTSTIKGAIGSVGKLATGIGVAGVAIKTTVNAIKETSEAFKAEALSLKGLENAIQNNPLTNGEGVDGLKDFAAQIQKTTNYGDDYLFPFMTQLIASGRTQAETMKIIQTATDIASSGTMSFESAIQQLNATMNGNIGRLGQQNAELKTLTQEELKSGKAVDILAGKYKGLAQSTVDTRKQLDNLKGDLKESLGELTIPIADGWNKFWIDFYERGINAINKIKSKMKDLQEESEYERRKATGSTTQEDTLKYYEQERQQLVMISDTYREILNNSENYSATEISNAQQAVQSYAVQIAKLDDKYKVAQLAVEKAKEETVEIEKQNSLLEKRREVEETVKNIKTNANKALEEQKSKWEAIELVTGKTVSNEEKLKFYQENLIEAVTQAKGEITEENQFYKDRVKIINELQNKIDKANKVNVNKERYERDLELQQDADEMSVQSIIGKNKKITEQEEKALKEQEERQNKQKELYKKLGNDIKNTMLNVAKTVGNIMKNMASAVFDALSGAFTLLKKLVNTNFSDLLDSVLKFEDGILTFIYETIPQIPSYVASILDSISIMVQSFADSFDVESVGNYLAELFQIAGERLPEIITNLTTILMGLIDGLIIGISSFIESGGLQRIADALLTSITKIFDKIFVDLLGNPTIKEGLANVLTSAFMALPDWIDSMFHGILNLLDVIVKAFNDWVQQGGAKKLGEVIADCLVAALDWIINNSPELIANIFKGVTDLVIEILKRLPQLLPKMIEAVISLGISVITNLLENLPDIVITLVKSLPDLFVEIAKTLWDAVWNGILSIGKSLGKGAKKVWDAVTEFLGFATGTNNAPRGLAVVGEAGPELVDFKGGERVYTAQNTKAILSGATSGGNSFNVTFNNIQETSAYTMMRQLKNYNRQMAINGVI